MTDSAPAMQPRRVAVVGLGYVGLPLAAAFAKVFPTIGYDISEKRVTELQAGCDRTGMVASEDLRRPSLTLTSDPACLRDATFIVVAVPTPVDRAKQPDLTPLVEASKTVGRHLRQGAIVVYESTVYPGCTEEVCVPILEGESGLKAGEDFHFGYSPERLNPGDSEHRLETIVKVVAGQDPATTNAIADVYGAIIPVGVYRAPDVRTAEAAKVIENVQRDINIALMNELALLFHRIGLDTREVLQAARTKWNFLPFEPGLVGGHCIPVDPYYLAHKAAQVGYHPEVVLAGRRVNDQMGTYVARQTVKLLNKAGRAVRGARALVLGVAFKEDVGDARNTRVADLVFELQDHGLDVVVHDPLVDDHELARMGLRSIENPFGGSERYDAIVLAVPHKVFMGHDLKDYEWLLRSNDGLPGVLVDVKGALRRYLSPGSPVLYWTL